MKKFTIAATIMLASSLILVGCSEEPCQHADADHNHICDICKEVVSECEDTNNDHLCDLCGKTLSECLDSNHDHVCDICSTSVSEHVDDDHNHLCDICDSSLSDHIDADFDHWCDYCYQAIPGVKSVSFTEKEVGVEVNGEVDLSDLVVVNTINGASEEVTWSSENENIATVDENGVVHAHDSGVVNIVVASATEPTKKDTIKVKVCFEKSFEEYGYNFTSVYPVKEIAKFTGSYNIFIPNQKFTELGMWYKVEPTNGYSASVLTVVFNIGSMTERDSLYGNEILSDLEHCDSYYPFLDIETESTSYMSNDFEYILSWTGLYNESYSNMYLAFYYTLVDEMFYGPAKTSNRNWTASERGLFKETMGEVIPFLKLGEFYSVQYSEDSDIILMYDYSCDYKIGESCVKTLLSNGYTYSISEGAYFKEISPNKSIFVQVNFTSVGNTIFVYTGNTVYEEFPQEIVDDFVTNVVGSSNKVIGFDLTNETLSEYRVYIEEDEWDSYLYSDVSCEVRGLLATYEEFVELKEAYEAAGFELVDTLYYEVFNPEHLYQLRFKKGALEVDLCCEPQYEFNWDTFEQIMYWDMSTICLNVHHSDEFETTGVHFYSNNMSIRTDDYCPLLEYAITDLENPVITWESSDEDIAYVDDDGYLIPVSAGTAAIKVIADGTYSDTLNVNVEWGYSNEQISFEYLSIEANPTLIETENLVIEIAQGEATNAASYDETTGTLTLEDGNVVTVSSCNNHMINEFAMIESYDYNNNRGELVANDEAGFVDDITWFANDLETSSFSVTVVGGTLTITGFEVYFDDVVLHTSSLAFRDMAAFTAANMEEMGYTVSFEPMYGDDYPDVAWTLIAVDDFMYPYSDYGDDGLEYEMWDLAYYVPEQFTDEIFNNMYMGDHYMYELTGCMCDVVVDGIELDIMIYADPEGSGSTIIQIDFWNWN